MYISINMDTLRFLHKHEDPKLVCNLVFIEAPHDTVDILPIDSSQFLIDATETEMQGLYKHTTSEDSSVYHTDQLREVLRALADKLPVSDVDPWQAELQCVYLEKKDPKGVQGYRYVKNAMVPNQISELWPPLHAATVLTPEEAATAARKRAQHPAATPAGTVAAPRAPRAPSAPRAGGVRETIWKIADAMWEEDGRPVDKPGVLSLRKKIMDVLENKHQIKRTSSSNELGNWQKARV